MGGSPLHWHEKLWREPSDGYQTLCKTIIGLHLLAQAKGVHAFACLSINANLAAILSGGELIPCACTRTSYYHCKRKSHCYSCRLKRWRLWAAFECIVVHLDIAYKRVLAITISRRAQTPVTVLIRVTEVHKCSNICKHYKCSSTQAFSACKFC